MLNRKLAQSISTLILTVAVGAAPALAPQTAHAWISSGAHVAEILIWSDGHATVRFTEFAANTACGTPFFSLGGASAPQQRAMLSVAQSALLSGRPVAVASTANNCQGQQERIDRLSLL